MARITAQQLKNKSACPGQVRLFRHYFGESVEINPILCSLVFDKFDFFWAAAKFLDATRYNAWDDARKVVAHRVGHSFLDDPDYMLAKAELFGIYYDEQGD
jgi:hypothetical protein